MNVAAADRDLRSSALAMGLAMAAAAALLYLVSTSSVKILAAIVGGVAFVVAAFLSGNPRLFLLWALMFALPFDLSKRFGTVIPKMGGEVAFRAELADPFMLGILAFVARDIWTRRLSGLRIPKLSAYWLALAFVGCLWAAFGTYRLAAAMEVVRMLKDLLLFVVVCNELQRPARVLHAAAALTLSVAFQACVGIYQYVTHAHLGLEILGETGAGTSRKLAETTIEGESAFRAGAFLDHPNIFGIFLACLLPIAVALFLRRVRPRYDVFFFVSIVLGSVALISTLSRSGWVSFTIAFLLLLLLLFFHSRLRRQSLLTAVSAGAALLVVVAFYWQPISDRIFESQAHAILSRWEHILTAGRMIEARPVLGWGLNSYAMTSLPFSRFGARAAHKLYQGTEEHPGLWTPPVHNIYMLWCSETGVVGLALFLALLAHLVWTAWRNLKVRDVTMFVINAACLCGIVALMADGFASFSLRINSILRIFWVLAAMIMAVHYWRLRETHAETLRPPDPDDAA